MSPKKPQNKPDGMAMWRGAGKEFLEGRASMMSLYILYVGVIEVIHQRIEDGLLDPSDETLGIMLDKMRGDIIKIRTAGANKRAGL